MSIPKQIETAACSTRGKRKRNEDYALFEPDTGGCVADGVGGAPLGDAIARYACHIAQRELDNGSTASEAAASARMAAERFIEVVDAEGSGASLLVYRLREGGIELASYGNVACVSVPPAQCSSRQDPTGDVPPDPRISETCSGTRQRTDTATKAPSKSSPCHARPGGEGERSSLVPRSSAARPHDRAAPSHPIGSTETNEVPYCYHFEEIGRLALCTDGVWKEIARSEVARILVEAQSPREAAAMLTLGHQAQDNATALVMFGKDDPCNS